MKILFAASLLLLALSHLSQVDASAYDKIVSHSRIRAKKQGINMCAIQEIIGTKKKYFSTCRNWYMGSICGKKALVLYECCPGYMQLEGMRGCPAAVPIDTIYGTLGVVKADITKQYVDMSKLTEQTQGAGSYTMFAPSDEAWEQLDATKRTELLNNENTLLYDALHCHMVSKRFLTKDLKNDMTLESMHSKLGLYINHYSNGIITVNCARIIHGNQVATNGVVHVIDRVIASVKNTIRDVIGTNEELSSLNRAVKKDSSLLGKLGQPGQYTLFAPTNKAFEKHKEGLKRILQDKTLVQAFLKYHLLSSVQCSEAILAGSRYETLEGSSIEIGCDGDSLTVNGIKMVLKKDIVTSNGVIHLIDQVLMPDSVKQVTELVGESQSTFGHQVTKLGLAAAMGPGAQYTLLAPLNTVFTDKVMSMDQHLLKIILKNHILKLKVTLSDLYNGQLLETLGGKFLRVFVYRTTVCIENACMVRGSKEGSNGALHLMKSLISTPSNSMYELLQKNGSFTVFLSLMEIAGLTELLKQEGAYTIFAPMDDAFDGVTEQDMKTLTSDINALRIILLYHFSNGIFISGGLEGSVTNLLETMQGNNLQMLSVNNSILVNSVNVPNKDLMASNGVIHVIKTLLYPGDLPVGREDLLYLLQKFIKYMQIKFVSGFNYKEVPFTFINKITTHVVESVPEITITNITVIGADSSVMKVESNPKVKHVVIEGKPKITKVTRIIEGEPTVIGGGQAFLDGEGEAGFTTRVIKPEPRVIEGPDFSKIMLIDAESEKISKLIKQGGAKRRAAVRRSPAAGMKRRVRVLRRHKPSQ